MGLLSPRFGLLGGFVLTVVAACDADLPVEPAGDASNLTAKADDPSGCDGPQPRCVGSCGDRARDAQAACVDGVWRCPFGIREDFCCDPVLNPGACPDWGPPCDPNTPCPDGYSCVESRNWPLPHPSGTCRLGDWRIPEVLTQCDTRTFVVAPSDLLNRPTGMVHVEGVVRAVMKCDDLRCTADKPCCQTCTGSYELQLLPDDRLPFAVALRAQTLACAGTNCGFSCAPLQAGRRYRIWGLWSPEAAPARPGMIYLAGFCTDGF
jgi:hypothetical protein